MARILVSDDDPLMRDMVNVTLSRAGHAVEVVATGEQLWANSTKAISNSSWPTFSCRGGTGIELLISMRAKRIEMPFICISGGDGDLFRPLRDDHGVPRRLQGFSASLSLPINCLTPSADAASAEKPDMNTTVISPDAGERLLK